MYFPFALTVLCSGKMTVEVNFSRVGSTQALLQDNAVWGVDDKNGIGEKPFEHIYMTKWACSGEDKVMGTYAYVRTAKVGDFSSLQQQIPLRAATLKGNAFNRVFTKIQLYWSWTGIVAHPVMYCK